MSDPEAAAVAIPLAEEIATVGKHVVTTGRIHVQTTTQLHEQIVREDLTDERVEVERVRIDRVVETLPQLRSEGDVTIIPVVEERLVITKQLVLVEEVRIRRRRSSEHVELPVTLRRQTAEIVEQDVPTKD